MIDFNQSYELFLDWFANYEGPALSLMMVRDQNPKNTRLQIVCVAQHINEALEDDIADVTLVGDGHERYNQYTPKPFFKSVWNGLGSTPEERLAKWKEQRP